MCSKLTKKAPERRHSRISVLSLNIFSNLFLVFLLLTLNKQMLARFPGVQKQSLEDVDVFKDVDVS